MGLLAPWFLGGIAAIGIPIYLHLLRRHSATPRPFSSLIFFERLDRVIGQARALGLFAFRRRAFLRLVAEQRAIRDEILAFGKEMEAVSGER